MNVRPLGHALYSSQLLLVLIFTFARWWRLVEHRRFLSRAATRGDAGAQTALAMMNYDGVGGPQDFAEARRQYGLAAVQGNASAH